MVNIFLKARPIAAKLFSIPIIGYLCRIVVGVIKLPRLRFHFFRLEQELAELRARVNSINSATVNLPASVPAQPQSEPPPQSSSLHEHLPRILEAISANATGMRELRRLQLKQTAQSQPATRQVQVEERGHGGFIPELALFTERELRRNRSTSLNRLPALSDWAPGGALSEIMKNLDEPVTIHRKAWEYAICVHGLTQLGKVTENARALAIGAGHEKPLFYFANHVSEMVATGLYDDPEHEGRSDMLVSPEKFAPFPYRTGHLRVLRMGGDSLDFPDRSFDFLLCLSPNKNFGSRDIRRRSFSEMCRVLKSGGIACIITDLVLNGQAHHEYYSVDEVREAFLCNEGVSLVGGELDLRMSRELMENPIDIREPMDATASPHIVLTDGKVVWTSLSVFLRKN